MVQSFKRGTAVRPGQLKKSHQGSHKFKKREALKKKAKVGQQVKLPTRQKKGLDYALEDAALSSAILKANEAKVASRLLQAGGKISIGARLMFFVVYESLTSCLSFLFTYTHCITLFTPVSR